MSDRSSWAGSGKSSLLRAWADRPSQQHRLAIVQVQRDKEDAQIFWLAMLKAVRDLSGDLLDVVQGSPLAPAALRLPAVQELSPTELRVARYLPTNLPRPEIASELSISINTVNTHIRNICAKLQASDRSSAVRRARELQLVASRAPR